MEAKAQRLDTLMVERGLAESRSRAQGLILAGAVRVGADVGTKAGLRVPPAKHLSLAPGGPLCMDAGASTGGFTDVLLKRGADKVLAVDVGYGQLDWSLRQHPKVTVL